MTTTAQATDTVRHRLSSTQSWDEAVAALIAAIEPTITRVVDNPTDSFSPNAYKRNGWTSREKVTFTGTFVLNGEDISLAVTGSEEGYQGFKTRKTLARTLDDTLTDFADELAPTWLGYLDGSWGAEICAFLDTHFGVTPQHILDELNEVSR